MKRVLRLGYEYSALSALNPKSLNPFFLLLLLLMNCGVKLRGQILTTYNGIAMTLVFTPPQMEI